MSTEVVVQIEPPDGRVAIPALAMGARNSQIVSGALKSSLGTTTTRVRSWQE